MSAATRQPSNPFTLGLSDVIAARKAAGTTAPVEPPAYVVGAPTADGHALITRLPQAPPTGAEDLLDNMSGDEFDAPAEVTGPGATNKELLALLADVTPIRKTSLTEDVTGVDPIEALRHMKQRTVETSRKAYDAVFAARGLAPLEEWAWKYLAARNITGEVAAARGYVTGRGMLPHLDEGLGKWTNKQQQWATSDEDGKRWLGIPWLDAYHNIVAWQVRWHDKDMRVEIHATEKGEEKDFKKFDFPIPDGESRLVDAMHQSDDAAVMLIIESPVRADCIASTVIDLSKWLSVVAVGGITMAYEGKGNDANPSDVLGRLSPAMTEALGGDLQDKHVLWAPDADHAYNWQCNNATQSTVESLLDEGVAYSGVVDVPQSLVHPRSGRVHAMPDGAGLDDVARHMDAILPGEQWLGPLLADAIEGTDYIAMYPRTDIIDTPALAEALASTLARNGVYKFVPTGKKEGLYYTFDQGFWGIDVAEARVTVEGTGVANRVFDRSSKAATAKARIKARTLIKPAVAMAVQTEVGLEHIMVHEGDWEPREYSNYLPTPDGLLNLETLELTPHAPEARNLGVTPMSYKPGATHPDWDKFCAEFFVKKAIDSNGDDVLDENGEQVWEHDADLERMMQQAAGAALHARCFDTAYIMVGAGGAGMSTFTGALQGILPTIYQGALSSEELTGKDNNFVLSSVYMSRMTAVSEFRPGDLLNEGLFKKITQDNGKVSVEAKYGDKFLSIVRPTLFADTNHLPRVSAKAGGDNSLRRRLTVTKYGRIVKNPDKQLGTRLGSKEAREAILAWAIRGAWQIHNEEGGSPYRSPASDAAVEEWLTDYDRLGKFVEDALEVDVNGYAERGAVYEAYEAWCDAERMDTKWRMERSVFYSALTSRKGFGVSDKNGNRRVINGVTVRGWKGWKVLPHDAIGAF
ncbi:phage/plasmid primase, P4 family [Nocardioides campestrisoli]|uniref:phage/plasmid primase, P4 family n=1 Tax=Nocardioides campestrisoli TaxID=2736757 RepID=UPI00163DC112|nr:phage/plasmid primase, P4 family [Nocardioides campestrisoli]